MKNWKTKVRVGQRLALSTEQAVSVKFASMPKLKITKSPVVYKVKSGDNLRELARIFGKAFSDMKQVNRGKNKIMVGQKITLPDSQKAIYTVKHGDHLSKVSKDLKQPIEEIMKLNNLTKRKIHPGQKLIVDMD